MGGLASFASQFIAGEGATQNPDTFSGQTGDKEFSTGQTLSFAGNPNMGFLDDGVSVSAGGNTAWILAGAAALSLLALMKK